MNRYFLPVILSVLLFGLPGNAQDDQFGDQPGISAHWMDITLEPETHILSGGDTVMLEEPYTGEFSFTLNSGLEIVSIFANDIVLEFETEPYTGEGFGEVDDAGTVQVVKVALPQETELFNVWYSGEIYDPIDPSNALSHVRGDYTSGIISPEGVYLSSETGWYPDTPGSMSHYFVSVELPDGWSSVCQGEKVDLGLGENTDSWGGDIPSDGCMLVANQYYVRSLESDGVTFSTYFYNDEPELSDSFLNKLQEYLSVYEGLLGPFPYKRFDVVENFFSTGYGMPGFTLLGSQVLRMPYATMEGSLAHELVHCWWGNGVFVDWDEGNWCEGLTTFCTNYYWNVVSAGEEEAADYRFLQMMKYSIQVNGEDEYPAREFRSKWTEVDGHIGYGKVSGMFIQLEKILGDETFFDALKALNERCTGLRTSWDDIQEIFEDVSGKDLENFFSSWLDNKGIPEPRIEGLQTVDEGENFVTAFRIVQDEIFYIYLPLTLHSSTGRDMSVVTEIFGDTCDVTITHPGELESIDIDPESWLFRRLSRDEIPPCLNLTLEDDDLLVIVPSEGHDDMLTVRSMYGSETQMSVHDHYQALADRIIESGTVATVKYDGEVTMDDLGSNSILCFGSPSHNSEVEFITDSIGNEFVVSDDGFLLRGFEYDGQGNSILVSFRNPWNDEKYISFYMGNSPEAIFKAGYMFFYGWDSYVVYDGGNPVDRGMW